MSAKPMANLQKLTTGIAGFDLIAHGGLPKGRSTVVAGSAMVGFPRAGAPW